MVCDFFFWRVSIPGKIKNDCVSGTGLQKGLRELQTRLFKSRSFYKRFNKPMIFLLFYSYHMVKYLSVRVEIRSSCYHFSAKSQLVCQFKQQGIQKHSAASGRSLI